MTKRLIIISAILFVSVAVYAQGPHKVTIEKTPREWQMKVDGKPFFVHGASVYNSQPFYGMIANYGANTVRLFRLPGNDNEAKSMLDKIAGQGLMAHVGLGFNSIRSGYYKDNEEEALAKQEILIMGIVRKFKDHPAILCWCIGNEFEIGHASEPLTPYYESIQRISKKIHEIDPNHPVTLAIVDGFAPAKIEGLMKITTDLDFISINGYLKKDNTYKIPETLQYLKWDIPYMTTELGPEGWWLHEDLGPHRFTDWGCTLDVTSTEKEAKYEFCMQKLFKDPACIGVLTFLWGNQTGPRDEIKEWYGLLDVNGYTYGAVDIMQYFWTGHYPEARAPRIESSEDITMNGKYATDWIHVEPGSKNKAAAVVGNPAGVNLRYHWRIVAERSKRIDNKFPDGISGLIANDGNLKINFVAPYKPGAYRLYLHVYDDVNRKAAYASIPFCVDGDAEALTDLGGRP